MEEYSPHLRPRLVTLREGSARHCLGWEWIDVTVSGRGAGGRASVIDATTVWSSLITDGRMRLGIRPGVIDMDYRPGS
jgi:hypothetical protein